MEHNIKCHVILYGRRGNECTAAIEVVMCVEQDSLTEPIPLQFPFFYTDCHLREFTMRWYLIHTWSTIDSHLFYGYSHKMNETKPNRNRARHKGFIFRADNHYTICKGEMVTSHIKSQTIAANVAAIVTLYLTFFNVMSWIIPFVSIR